MIYEDQCWSKQLQHFILLSLGFLNMEFQRLGLYPCEDCHQYGMLIARALLMLHYSSFSNIYFIGLKK